MLTYILIGVAVCVVVFVIVVMRRPQHFTVERQITIGVTPFLVFSQVNDLHKWEAWSPWAKIDPAAKMVYAGPPAGLGANMDWEGNQKVGAGRMTITQSEPDETVGLRLDFRKPFAATNAAQFTFKPQGQGTAVKWCITGKNNFIFKAVGLFINCDDMIGRQFDKGLADLKKICEARVA